jgi:hypothetical protein
MNLIITEIFIFMLVLSNAINEIKNLSKKQWILLSKKGDYQITIFRH